MGTLKTHVLLTCAALALSLLSCGQAKAELITAGDGNDFALDDISLDTSAVPEPASVTLLDLGGIGLALSAYGRRRSTAVSAVQSISLSGMTIGEHSQAPVANSHLSIISIRNS